MVKFYRFRIKGAKFILIKENGSSYDVAFSRFPVWGTAIKNFRNINHVNIGSNILSSERVLLSKVKEDELNYTIRLPIREDIELCVELENVEETGLRALNIEIGENC